MAKETGTYIFDTGQILDESIGPRINLDSGGEIPDLVSELDEPRDKGPGFAVASGHLIFIGNIGRAIDPNRINTALEAYSVNEPSPKMPVGFYGPALRSIPPWANRLCLATKVNEAKERILRRLEEDRSDEGWPPYQKKTLDDAIEFLCKLDTEQANEAQILAASGGSIDLHWKMDKFELLINFKPNSVVGYYGDDYHGNLIQGRSCPKPYFIMCWMRHTSE